MPYQNPFIFSTSPLPTVVANQYPPQFEDFVSPSYSYEGETSNAYMCCIMEGVDTCMPRPDQDGPLIMTFYPDKEDPTKGFYIYGGTIHLPVTFLDSEGHFEGELELDAQAPHFDMRCVTQHVRFYLSGIMSPQTLSMEMERTTTELADSGFAPPCPADNGRCVITIDYNGTGD